ncbi:MAG: hypothetical protein H7Z38_03150 [Rubrivivax sp.]|nr:hypothetical protein [Pyrinomonadaceae bacterium]
MKTKISVLFVVLLCAVNAPAQTSATATVSPDILVLQNIVVLQKNWRVDVRNSALDEDPFSANSEFSDAQRAQKVSDLQNIIRARGGESREPPPPRVSKNKSSSPRRSETYIYRTKIKNAGLKTIRVVDWGYVFIDPDTQQELGLHRYINKVKIRPGQNSDLVGRSASPPTSIVNVKNAGKEPSEQIVIYRVEYDDGSVWQNPTK